MKKKSFFTILAATALAVALALLDERANTPAAPAPRQVADESELKT